MAARMEPGRVQAAHQSLHHFVAKADWSRIGADSRAPSGGSRGGGGSPATVLADAGYGIDTDFRDGVTALGLSYVVGIQSSTSLWTPGTGPLPPSAGAALAVRPR